MNFKVGDVVRRRGTARVVQTFGRTTTHVKLEPAMDDCHWWTVALLVKVRAAKKKPKTVPTGRRRK